MSQNTVHKGRDNPVVIMFSGVDLTLFTKVTATFGSDVRDSVNEPTEVVVVSATELHLKFGTTTETTGNYWLVIGYDAINTNGVELTSRCMGNLAASPICEE